MQLKTTRIFIAAIVVLVVCACKKKLEPVNTYDYVYIESTLKRDTIVFQDPTPFTRTRAEKPFLLYTGPGSGTIGIPRAYMYTLDTTEITTRMLGGGELDTLIYPFLIDSAQTIFKIGNFYDRPDLASQDTLTFQKLIKTNL
ncbi:hypothetical protein LX64_04808 [Chitinophaga skermanii]|uniref:Uncharacterized protein n=1 Tax=Chitinophaga skermanii TaxID=331697 RepID=A0A327Q9G3_9BACT|nr:hypothetical protein [Chitinophaga skermanii]RAI98446.1 hypothetical protein LX64_04808 [Chitinophaga skermanii]